MFSFLRRKKKSFERDTYFYDDIYRTGGHLGSYHLHYSESPYLRVWQRGLEIIASLGQPDVLDIGCGPGQFANLLYDNGVTAYTGIDHSAEAVKLARQNVPALEDKFIVGDVFSPGILPKCFDITVLFEVLEHMERDLDLLALFPGGKRVLFSVPSYSSPSHVRRFKTSQSVMKRYQKIVDIISLDVFQDCPEEGKTIYLVYGTMKSHSHQR